MSEVIRPIIRPQTHLLITNLKLDPESQAIKSPRTIKINNHPPSIQTILTRTTIFPHLIRINKQNKTAERPHHKTVVRSGAKIVCHCAVVKVEAIAGEVN